MADAVDGAREFADETERAADAAERQERATRSSLTLWEKMKALTGGSSQTGANQQSSAPGGVPASAGGSTGGGVSVNATDYLPSANFQNVPQGQYRGEKTASKWSELVGAGLGAVNKAAAAMALLAPTADEALTTSLMAERLRFYGMAGSSGGPYGRGGGFDVQRRFASLGLPTSALDAVRAANAGGGMGLLPGLSNYASGVNSGTYGGILGGAAFASNLVPGMGLTAGMGAMSSLNTARSVNLLRMIGINVRSSTGDTMRDLPAIIKDLWTALKQANGGKNPTTQDIAVSAMSGNALDSILNQYFSGDPNLRQAILAGLIQLANSGGTFADFVNMLQKSGGLTRTTRSLGQRTAKELELIQAYTDPTLKGITVANDALNSLYGFMINRARNGNRVFLGGAAGLSGLETFGGARNGAGALLMSSVGDLAGGIASLFPSKPLLGSLLSTAGLAGASFLTGEILNNVMVGSNIGFTPGQPFGSPGSSLLGSGSTAGIAPRSMFNSTAGGGATINVYNSAGVDGVSQGAAISSRINSRLLSLSSALR